MNFHSTLTNIMIDFKQKHSPRIFRDKIIYADWLAQTYFFVCHSTPLLGFSLPHLKNQSMRHHFEHHIGEEARHDMLALKDLERLGYTIDQFEQLAQTQAFYQAQYFKIQFDQPTSLLGYILYLETMACDWGKLAYEEVKSIYPNSCLFLKIHAEEDPSHVKNAIKAIESLPEVEKEAVFRNLLYSAQLYDHMIDKIAFSRDKTKAA